jgi:hypothetical protein
LEYTPQELSGVLFYHNQKQDALFKSDWERTRIQTFYLLNIQLDKKNKFTYEKFKKDVWPFFWENKKTKQVNEEEIMNMDQWMDIISKPVISQEVVSSNSLEI